MTKKKRIGPCKLVTLGRIALLFYNNREQAYAWMDGWPDKETILYEGTTPIPDPVCQGIAPLHKKFIQYYKDAMAPLYAGTGPLRGGTENATMAVNGYGTISGGSGFYAHCLVWNPMGIEYWPDEPKMYPCLGGSLTRVCSKDAL